MKKLICIVICIFTLLSCMLPVQAVSEKPEKHIDTKKPVSAIMQDAMAWAKEANVDAVLEKQYQEAEALAAEGKHAHAGIAFAKLEGYKDSKEQSLIQWKKVSGRKTIALFYGLFALKDDGTVLFDAADFSGSIEDLKEYYDNIYKDIVSIHGYVGLKNDGTLVIATKLKEILGDYRLEELLCQENVDELSSWTDIVAVTVYDRKAIVGITVDGNIVSVGFPQEYENAMENWSDIVSVAMTYGHVVGLKSDGTVSATGMNDFGQCDVADWKNITAIATCSSGTLGLEATFGLNVDGTVLSTGSNQTGAITAVRKWSDIDSIEYGPCGIKKDGTVVSHITGKGDGNNPNDIRGWENIVAVITDETYTVGLKIDGTLVFSRNAKKKYSEAGSWTNIQVPQ